LGEEEENEIGERERRKSTKEVDPMKRLQLPRWKKLQLVMTGKWGVKGKRFFNVLFPRKGGLIHKTKVRRACVGARNNTGWGIGLFIEKIKKKGRLWGKGGTGTKEKRRNEK